MAELDPHAWRERFPVLREVTYLVSHSLGAMPRGVYAKLQSYADQWATRGARAWDEGWWTSPLDVGSLVARLMNAPAGTVTMHQNVSLAQAVLASSLDFSGRRNKVVYTDQDFPSVMYVWQATQRRGARVQAVPSVELTGSYGPSAELLSAIDEETLVVAINHVSFKTSQLQDVAAITARAHEVGALVVLDVYQSLGSIPVDVRALGVDFACGGSVKWLCGGPGAGFLYVREEHLAVLEPAITGWAGHAAPFAFEAGPQRYAADGRRLLQGTPAVPALMAATAGHETILEVGVERIRAHSLHLTGLLRGELLARGFRCPVPADPAWSGGTLLVALDGDEDGAAFVRALSARAFLVDHRPAVGLRVGPHFYNTSEEVLDFAAALGELRVGRAWEAHVAAERVL